MCGLRVFASFCPVQRYSGFKAAALRRAQAVARDRKRTEVGPHTHLPGTLCVASRKLLTEKSRSPPCTHCRAQIRSRALLESLQQQHVSLQLRRESIQARVTTQLARDVAAHQRRCYLEEREATLAEAESTARMQSKRLQGAAQTTQVRCLHPLTHSTILRFQCIFLNHEPWTPSFDPQVMLQVMKEDLATLRQEREVFLREQTALLKHAARELQEVEAARMDALKRTLEHEEEKCVGGRAWHGAMVWGVGGRLGAPVSEPRSFLLTHALPLHPLLLHPLHQVPSLVCGAHGRLLWTPVHPRGLQCNLAATGGGRVKTWVGLLIPPPTPFLNRHGQASAQWTPFPLPPAFDS